MRDFKLNVLEDSILDIDIIGGEAAYLEYEAQTYDQRAAIAVYTIKGTVPGALDYGVNWTSTFTNENTLAQLSNEVQQQLEQEAGTSESAINTSATYTGVMTATGGEPGVLIMRS